jgi:hypothetical protein
MNTHLSHLHVLWCGSGRALRSVLPVKNRLPVLIQLDGGNDDIAWVDANGGCRAIRLVALDSVDVDDPLFPVNLCDFAFPALVFSPCY